MRKAAVLGFAALAAALAPLHATVYVPVGDGPLGAARSVTEVVVTNPDAVARQLTATFLPDAGSARTGSPVTVPARGTFVLADLAPAGERGLLAIDGAAQLVVTARLVTTDAGGKTLASAAAPVVSEGSLIPAGTVIHLQGLARTGRAVSRLGLIALGDAPGNCTVAAFRADGSGLGEAVRIALPARGQSEVEDALAALGRGGISEARLTVTCDVPAFAWAAVLARDGSRIATVAPASALGQLDADLASVAAKVRGEGGDGGRTPGPGTGGTGGSGGNPGGSGGKNPGDGNPRPTDDNGSFSVAGTFLDATPGNSDRTYDLALKPGVRYKLLTVEFDLFLNRWQSPLFHAVTGLRRADKTLYYGLILRADRAKTILDLGQGQLAKDGGGLWEEQTEYHLRTTYDVASRQVTLEVFRGGTRVEVLSGAMTSTDLRATNKGVRIDFGIPRVADGAYFPPVGWRFSNLQVTAVPF